MFVATSFKALASIQTVKKTPSLFTRASTQLQRATSVREVDEAWSKARDSFQVIGEHAISLAGGICIQKEDTITTFSVSLDHAKVNNILGLSVPALVQMQLSELLISKTRISLTDNGVLFSSTCFNDMGDSGESLATIAKDLGILATLGRFKTDSNVDRIQAHCQTSVGTTSIGKTGDFLKDEKQPPFEVPRLPVP